MKKLAILNDSGTFKVSDTDTLIPFGVYDGNNPVALQQGETTKFRIKNNIGFLMSVGVTNTNSGYTFNLNTKDLTTLTPGDYQIELTITDSDNNTAIYPDTGYVTITISDNALSITGQQLSYLSLDDFKKDVQAYVNSQVSTAQTNIKNNFNSYVQSITDSTVNQASQAVNTANQANNTANQAKTTAQSAVDTVKKQAQQVSTNTSNLTNVMNTVNSIYPAQVLYNLTNTGKLTDLNNLPFGLWPVNGWVSTNTDINNYPDFAKGCWGMFISLPIGQAANKGNLQIYTANNTFYSRTRYPGSSDFSAWIKLGGVASLFTQFSAKIETLELTNLNDCPLGVYQVNTWGKDKNITNVPSYQGFATLVVLPFWVLGGTIQIWLCPDYIAYRFSSDQGNTNWGTWQKLTVTPLS